ncbi:MAG: hypothetical protein RIK87_08960 [Fuerstiella sp.]
MPKLLPELLSDVLFSSRRRSATRQRRLRCGHGARPVETLESRTLLSGTTFRVTSLADSGAGSLRQAIIDANQNPGDDNIRFARQVRGTIALSSQLVITDDVTIHGPGANRLTVSGDDGIGDATRIFAVLPPGLAATPFMAPSLAQLTDSPTVSIEKLAINDGLARDAPGFDPTNPATAVFAFGGGLYNMGGSVRLSEVSMSGNRAENVITAGGAVANEFGGTLVVSRSHFAHNTSSGILVGVGGAITSDLGPAADAPTTGQPTTTVDRSTFVGNTAEAFAGYVNGEAFSGLGGGGAILNVTGSLTVSRSHFADNLAQGGAGVAGIPGLPDSTAGGAGFGGAVLSGDASPFGIAESSLEISRTTFTQNVAMGGAGGVPGLTGGSGSGGAVAVGNGNDAELERNLFSGNLALGGAGGDGAAGGIGTGGGVSANGGAVVTLDRNQYLDNTATGGDGGGIGPGAAGRGGGLSLDSVDLAGFFPGTATAFSDTDKFHGNQAIGGIGGGIYNEGDLTLSSARLTDNRAIGQADTTIDFVPGYLFQGAALGGGLSNLGTTDIRRSRFQGNEAIGADGAVGPDAILAPPGTALPTYPGLAVGGGLHNVHVADVTRSQFSGNQALGGNNNSGSFAGVGNGGGIYNDSSLVVDRTTFSHNVAAGGADNTGDINAGGGYGGGIASGSVTALVPGGRSASVTVSRSLIYGNKARGGSGNTGLIPIPAHAAGGAAGGGMLVYQGTASVSGSTLIRNRAVGGDGGPGLGGGVFFFGFVGPVQADLFNSVVAHNTALGGSGADGLGGGIAIGSLGSLLGGPVDVTAERVVVSQNRAKGGSGGDGLGGGLYNSSDGTLSLNRALVFGNRAVGGSSGDGIGGGLYNLGIEDLTRILFFANFASTSDDDCFGCGLL